MRRNQLFINLLSSIVSFSLSLIISFILTPYLINKVGKEAYSFYPLANNFISYTSLLTMSLNSMSSRFISVEFNKNNIDNAKSYYSTIFFSNIILSTILVVIALIFLLNINKILDIPDKFIFDVKLMFLLLFLSSICNIFSSVFGIGNIIKNRMEIVAIKDIFQNVFKGILFIYIFKIFGTSIICFGVVAFILSFFNLIAQYLINKKIFNEININLKYFDFNRLKELILSGIWNSINSLGVILITSVSLFFSNALIGVDATGDLSIVQVLPNFITTIISSIYGVLLPRVMFLYTSVDKNVILNSIVIKYQKVLSIIAIVPILLAIVFGEEFFRLWIPSEDSKYLQNLSIILLSPLIIHANMWILNSLNLMNNTIRIPSIILIIVGILNIVIIFTVNALIDIKLIHIVFISSVLNILYYMIFIPIYTANTVKIDLYSIYRYIIKSLFFCILFIIISLYIKKYIIINGWIDLFLWSCIFGTIYILILIIVYIKK